MRVDVLIATLLWLELALHLAVYSLTILTDMASDIKRVGGSGGLQIDELWLPPRRFLGRR
jgi:hypothetical protein